MFASHSAPWQKRIDRYDKDGRAELTAKTHFAEKAPTRTETEAADTVELQHVHHRHESRILT